MVFTSIEQIDASAVKVKITGGKHDRETTLVIGQYYRVEPINVQKMRHRGRECEVRKFLQTPHGGKVSVKFSDNGRYGRVDFDDLLEID